MNAITKALAAIGMSAKDYERADFNRASGRRAAAALRAMGYQKQRFPTRAGSALILWAEPVTGAPVFLEGAPAFNVLVAAIARKG